MYVPIGDDRYFAARHEAAMLEEIPLYTSDEFEQEYPRISSTMPEIFSLNLREDITQFLIACPPQFGVELIAVLEAACYYYLDWEMMVAVTDEFVAMESIELVRKSLLATGISESTAEEQLQDLIVGLGVTINRMASTVIGILSRCRIPAIMDYGSCYRFDRIDDFGNVFFRLRNPPQVFDDITRMLNEDKQDASEF